VRGDLRLSLRRQSHSSGGFIEGFAPAYDQSLGRNAESGIFFFEGPALGLAKVSNLSIYPAEHLFRP